MNNFWNDRWEDNYYYDGHRHHHHHRKDDFFPRLLEGIVGGILSGSIERELDKLNELSFETSSKDKRKSDVEVQDIDDSDVELSRARREDFTPDQQILLNLELHAKTPTGEVNPRFERTG